MRHFDYSEFSFQIYLKFGFCFLVLIGLYQQTITWCSDDFTMLQVFISSLAKPQILSSPNHRNFAIAQLQHDRRWQRPVLLQIEW